MFVYVLRCDIVKGKAMTQCYLVEMLSHYLKELKTGIYCLGIEPKAIFSTMFNLPHCINHAMLYVVTRKSNNSVIIT